VANLSGAIKIACDFISIDNLKRTHRVVRELRHQRLAYSWDDDGKAWGDDPIELEKTLYYAYLSLTRRYKMASATQPACPAFTSSSIIHGQSAPINEETTPMDIPDGPLPSPAYGQSQHNDDLPSSSSLPADDLSCQDKGGSCSDKRSSKLSTAKKQKRREKTKQRQIAQRRALLIAELPLALGQIFPCPAPSCGRKLNKTGVLDHLCVCLSFLRLFLTHNANSSQKVHPDRISIDAAAETRLRQPDVGNDDFPRALRPYLCIEDQDLKEPYCD
jgi:hypothetical protein